MSLLPLTTLWALRKINEEATGQEIKFFCPEFFNDD